MLDNAMRLKYEKIANLLAQRVPANQIAMVVNLDESRISQIQTEPEFQKIMGRIVAENYEKDSALSEGWDGVEARALRTVFENLEHNRDKDFALKAAAVANKATRPISHRNNHPIHAGGIDGEGNLHSIIHLDVNIINQIEKSGGQLERVSFAAIPRKAEDSMTPKGVRNLLTNAQEELTLDDVAVEALTDD